MKEEECSGDDNMLMMRGAGGETHSVVVYRLTKALMDHVRGGRRNKNYMTEILSVSLV